MTVGFGRGKKSVYVFKGAHDSVNDAAITILNALSCAIAYARAKGILDEDGNLVSWKSKPRMSSFAWHITGLDAEGANCSPERLQELGVVHLRSVDVQGVPYCDWWRLFRCSIIFHKGFNDSRDNVSAWCPRPDRKYLWFREQAKPTEEYAIYTRGNSRQCFPLRDCILDEFCAYTTIHYMATMEATVSLVVGVPIREVVVRVMAVIAEVVIIREQWNSIAWMTSITYGACGRTSKVS